MTFQPASCWRGECLLCSAPMEWTPLAQSTRTAMLSKCRMSPPAWHLMPLGKNWASNSTWNHTTWRPWWTWPDTTGGRRSTISTTVLKVRWLRKTLNTYYVGVVVKGQALAQLLPFPSFHLLCLDPSLLNWTFKHSGNSGRTLHTSACALILQSMEQFWAHWLFNARCCDVQFGIVDGIMNCPFSADEIRGDFKMADVSLLRVLCSCGFEYRLVIETEDAFSLLSLLDKDWFSLLHLPVVIPAWQPLPTWIVWFSVPQDWSVSISCLGRSVWVVIHWASCWSASPL